MLCFLSIARAFSLERRNDVPTGKSTPPKLTMPTICPSASSAGPPLSPCSTLPPTWMSCEPFLLCLMALTVTTLTEGVRRLVGSRPPSAASRSPLPGKPMIVSLSCAATAVASPSWMLGVSVSATCSRATSSCSKGLTSIWRRLQIRRREQRGEFALAAAAPRQFATSSWWTERSNTLESRKGRTAA